MIFDPPQGKESACDPAPDKAADSERQTNGLSSCLTGMFSYHFLTAGHKCKSLMLQLLGLSAPWQRLCRAAGGFELSFLSFGPCKCAAAALLSSEPRAGAAAFLSINLSTHGHMLPLSSQGDFAINL